VADLPGWLKHTTVWLLLTSTVFLGVQAWQARHDAMQLVLDGGTLEIRRGADGHYHWPGRIAGHELEFLVDTGATGTAIPSSVARELGLKPVGSLRSSTAAGTVSGSIVVADVELKGGLRADRLRLASLPDLSAPLLGMDVLGKLQLQQADGVLRIDLRAAR
jgi:aspartyl protease family protein